MTDGDAEALRRRLYRPGASQDDVAAYLRTAEPRTTGEAAPEPAASPGRGPSLRPLVVGAAGVLVAAALGGALLLGGRAAPAPTRSPTPSVAIGTEDSNQVWFVASGTEPVFDGGERDGARGPSVAEGPDMVRYTIASGDTIGAIARRFSLCQGDVLLALPYGVVTATLPADQTLELSRSSTASPPDC